MAPETLAQDLERLPRGLIAAAVASRGAQPRRRAVDLVIAATANAHHVPLLTHDAKDFQVIADLVDVRAP